MHKAWKKVAAMVITFISAVVAWVASEVWTRIVDAVLASAR